MDKQLKQQIFSLVSKYYNLKHKENSILKTDDYINYSGRVFDEEEIQYLVDSALDFWLTTGKYTSNFEKEFSKFIGIKFCSLTNSGSSANLLAFMALTSPKLGQRQIKKGDEIITVAASFPTTITPIIQYGAIPVFIDITIPQYNIDTNMLEEALSNKTKAVMIAHTLGNPFDLNKVKSFCDKYNLWLIEDNCDALGSKYFYNGQWKYTGTIGDIATSSFYPPHHITMGEGGAVYTNSLELNKIVNSFRDWGRDCWCVSGKDDTCSKRFSQQFGELPYGYDHKYVYSHFGYNLKATDMQAAIGCAQLKKLNKFIEIRQKNWKLFKNLLEDTQDTLILPEAEINSQPSWFGYMISIKRNTNFTRDELTTYLEANHIQTRNLFAGNIIKHPCFDQMRKTNKGYRVCGALDNTDFVMSNTFWIGVYPKMTDEIVNTVAYKIKDFISRRK